MIEILDVVPVEEGNLAEITSEVTEIKSVVAEIAVSSDEEFDAAGLLAKRIKTAQKAVTDYWEPMRKQTYDAYTEVNENKKAMLNPLVVAEKTVKAKMSDWTIAKEKKRREIEEEARRRAAEAAQKAKEVADRLDAEGNVFEAEALRVEAEMMESVTVVVPKDDTKTKGVSKVAAWKITEITDAEVPTEINGVCIRPVDEKAVMKLIKASKGKIQIPGVKYTEDVSIRIR